MAELAAERASPRCARRSARRLVGCATTACDAGFAATGSRGSACCLPTPCVRASRSTVSWVPRVSSTPSRRTAQLTPALLDLMRDSAVPHILAELLGGEPAYYVARATSAQVALRFPGDMCGKGAESPRSTRLRHAAVAGTSMARPTTSSPA